MAGIELGAGQRLRLWNGVAQSEDQSIDPVCSSMSRIELARHRLGLWTARSLCGGILRVIIFDKGMYMADQPERLADSLNSDNRRSDQRQSVLKGAKMLFSESIIDCLVMNISETGARVRTAAIMRVPDRVMLRLSDGATFAAVRRWTQGMETGFSFEGTASLPDETAQVAWRIYEMIRAATIQEPLHLLEAAAFFGDLALQNVAEQAEAGLRTLEKELAKRVRKPT